MASELIQKISENIQDLLPIQILYFDAYGNISYMLLENTGVWGNCATIFDRIHPDDRQRLQDILEISEMDRSSPIEFLRVKSRSTDQYRRLEVIICKEVYRGKTLFRWVATDLEMLRSKMGYHQDAAELPVDTEPQTGLLNSRVLWKQVKKWLVENSSLKVGVLLITVGDIKKVKGFWGQEYANKQVTKLGEVLLSSVRKKDIVASKGGGEIIITVFEESDRRFSPQDLKKRLMKSIEKDDSLSIATSIRTKSFVAKKFHKLDKAKWLSQWKKELELLENLELRSKK